MAVTKGRPLSPNILDLRDPFGSPPLVADPFGNGVIPRIVDTWSQSKSRAGVRQSWEVANEVANRRKEMEFETNPKIVAQERARRKEAVEDFFGDPMKSGAKQEAFRRKMSDTISSFGNKRPATKAGSMRQTIVKSPEDAYVRTIEDIINGR